MKNHSTSPKTFVMSTKELFDSKNNPSMKLGVEEAWKIKQKNLPKLSGDKNSDGNLILPIADGKMIIRIQKLGQIGGEALWCDFEQVPQGYVHICGTGIQKPKRSRKFPHVNGYLIEPTDDQIIEQGKSFLARDLDPEMFYWLVENKS